MVKKLIWSNLAQKQKKEIYIFWNTKNKSKSYSIKLNDLFNKAAEMLIIFPKIGKKTNIDGIRLKLVRDFWLVYKITKEKNQILAIWNTYRNPEQLKDIIKK